MTVKAIYENGVFKPCGIVFGVTTRIRGLLSLAPFAELVKRLS